MLSFTLLTAVMVPTYTLTIGPGTVPLFQDLQKIDEEGADLEGKDEMVGTVAGTVVVGVSRYESCTDNCSYRTSRPDLTQLHLSERLCHSGAMPCRRTGEQSAKSRACTALPSRWLNATKDPHIHHKGFHPGYNICNLLRTPSS